MPAAPAFSYADLDTEKANRAREAADAIRGAMRQSVHTVGFKLQEMKKLLGHGHFLPWAQTELGVSPRSAQNYMNAASAVSRCATIAHLPPALLYRVAAPSLPEITFKEIAGKLAAADAAGAPLPIATISDRLAVLARDSRLQRRKTQDLEVAAQVEQLPKAVDEKPRAALQPLARSIAAALGPDDIELMLWALATPSRCRVLTELLQETQTSRGCEPSASKKARVKKLH